MHLYRFINPSAYGADKCVIFVSATSVEALNAYVDRHFPDCHGIVLSKDFHRGNVITNFNSIKVRLEPIVWGYITSLFSIGFVDAKLINLIEKNVDG